MCLIIGYLCGKIADYEYVVANVKYYIVYFCVQRTIYTIIYLLNSIFILILNRHFMPCVMPIKPMIYPFVVGYDW